METAELNALVEWLGFTTCIYAHPTTARPLHGTPSYATDYPSHACLHACLPRLRRLRVALVARANSQATPAAARSAIVRVPKARVQELVVKFRHLRRQRLVGQTCRCFHVALLLSRDAGHGRQLSH